MALRVYSVHEAGKSFASTLNGRLSGAGETLLWLRGHIINAIFNFIFVTWRFTRSDLVAQSQLLMRKANDFSMPEPNCRPPQVSRPLSCQPTFVASTPAYHCSVSLNLGCLTASWSSHHHPKRHSLLCFDESRTQAGDGRHPRCAVWQTSRHGTQSAPLAWSESLPFVKRWHLLE
ncbi:hypothetical protein LIA77_04166 [Sarocladium implicatum]|nr:hypothetical protein LIA77_04166 [Sarocladium implicatum]